MPDSASALRLIKNAAAEHSGGDSDVPTAPGFFGLDDVGNGERFARDWKGEALFCHEWNCWLVYQDGRWKKDNTGQIERMAKLTAKAIKEEPLLNEERDRPGYLVQCRYTLTKGFTKMITMAESEPGMFCTPDQFDRDPFLLNVLNGTLELSAQAGNGINENTPESAPSADHSGLGDRQLQCGNATFRFREARREDMLMHQAPVSFDPYAYPYVWLPVLKRIMASDKTMTRFLQRFAGLCLTGDVTDEAFFFFVGAGANGKSTFLSTMQALLGDDLSTTLPVDSFISKRNGEGIPLHIAGARAKRLVVVSENERGARFNAANLKMWTGDKRSGRLMRENLFTFLPTDKIVFQTNNMPTFNDNSAGFRRRLKVTPFKVMIPEKEMDRKLKEKLRDPVHMSGFLNWALGGLEMWHETGLDAPKQVVDASAELLALQDVIRTFVLDCLHSAHCPEDCLHELPAAAFEGDKKDVYDRYKRWCDDNGEGRPMSNRKFVPALRELGFGEDHSDKRQWWKGCKLKDGPLHSTCNKPTEAKVRAESDEAAADDPLFQT